MNLDLNKIAEKIEQNDFIRNFIQELNNVLESFNKKNDVKGEKMEEIKLSPDEDLEFYKKEMKFLQEYFKQELTKGEVYIVTNKYENDDELHRYKVTQYKNNFECKYVVQEKDLPQNVQIGDVVKKIDGEYFLDEEATKYVQETRNNIKQEIISKRENN